VFFCCWCCGMSNAPLFIGSEIYRLPVFKPPHPLAVPRAMLVKDICEACGWLEAARYYEAGPASVTELCRFHEAGYVAALLRAEAEQDLPVDGLEGYNDLFAAVGTFEGVEFEIV